MRNEMIGAVVRRAMEQPKFREELIRNPDEALSAHGFALEQEDMEEIRRIQRSLDTKSDQDIERELLTIAEEYGVHPAPQA